MKKYDIMIIGGGAAGLAAAVSAKMTNEYVKICIIEKGDRVGRKIHATGNGRCNFTNTDIRSEFFFGNRRFTEAVLKSFGAEDAIGFFEQLGVKHRVEEGRVYPISNQASAVADALRLYLAEKGVDFVLNTPVEKLEAKNGGFIARDIFAKKAIVATGGKASPNLGSDGSGYKLLGRFGHKLTATKPALVSLRTNCEVTKQLKGVKAFARVMLFDGDKEIARDRGEILFTEYGISGIPVMQISRFAKKGMRLEVDMLPDFGEKEVFDEIYSRIRNFPQREGPELFSGLVNKKIAVPMLRYARVLKANVKAKDFTGENVRKCGEFLKKFTLDVLGDRGFENAQVCAGGIELGGFDALSMESKRVGGLYAAGEILDCDALCGGYNLHWAWGTGIAAGRSAAMMG